MRSIVLFKMGSNIAAELFESQRERHQRLALWRQTEFSRTSHDQGRSKMFFQTLDASCNIRLHRVECGGRLRHVALPRHFKENRKINQKKSIHHTITFSDT